MFTGLFKLNKIDKIDSYESIFLVCEGKSMKPVETYVWELTRKSGKNISLRKGNEMLNANDRIHHMVKREITKHLRTLGCYTTKERQHTCYTPENPCIVDVVIYSPTKAIYDPPNWYATVKPLMDGMTDSGVWSDDNYTVIKCTTFRHGGYTTNSKWKIELNIYEVTNETDISI